MCPAFCIKWAAPLRPTGVLPRQQSMHFPRRVLHGRRAGAHVVAVVGLELLVAVEAGGDRVGQAGRLHQRLGRVPEHVGRDEAQAQRLQLRLVSVNLFFTSFAKQACRSRKGGFTGCANVFSPIPVTA